MAKSKKALPMPKITSPELNAVLAIVAAILIPIVRAMFRIRPTGQEKLPKQGPYILVANHVTNVDALAVAYFVYRVLKRAPHFLAKEGLFRVPVVGSILRAAGQIPVYRSGQRNDAPMRAANAFLEAGHTIAIFPEGTLTREPNLWPMRGKSGAIRLAIETNVPVYPMAHWGSEQILPQYGSKFRPGFWKPVDIIVGDEINLDKYRKKQLTPAELHEATDLVMREITLLVEKLRKESAPAERWDPVKAGQTVAGNFKKESK
ncbi:1-acyl-sn-glycerol-3-phosphate acyltransferase [Rhodoluna sp. KAS3]|nr:1-acyl-sn-glycerol-3-phosphate acyltransferase [Rhodoluna sp. KAS3]